MVRLPEKFLQRMQQRLGEQYPAFLASYERPPLKGLRVNTLKISAEEFCALAPEEFALGEKITESGFLVGGEKLGADPYHFAGLYYMQEPSAMKVGELTKHCKKERVLDLCAAPGGKTTHVAAQMAGRGILFANEIDFPRAKILSENVERMGIRNCATMCAPPETLAELFPACFDLILVDAPCSGEGMFKKEPNAIPEWSEENVARCAVRQKGILECAARMLERGGRIVYSTCTFAEEEDEWTVEAFLKEHPSFTLVEEEKYYPHEFRGEGHFAAVLEKREGESCAVRPFRIQKNAAAERAFCGFAEDFFAEPFRTEGRIHTLADGRMYLVPDGMPELSVRLLRLGVELGEWDGKNFKPAHALAMAFGSLAKKKISLSREEAKTYLRGETLTCDAESGWVAVCVDGFPLGLGKASNGTVKNHYPKGLRLRK